MSPAPTDDVYGCRAQADVAPDGIVESLAWDKGKKGERIRAGDRWPQGRPNPTDPPLWPLRSSARMTAAYARRDGQGFAAARGRAKRKEKRDFEFLGTYLAKRHSVVDIVHHVCDVGGSGASRGQAPLGSFF